MTIQNKMADFLLLRAGDIIFLGGILILNSKF